jgi:hypothetical protein
MSSATSRSSLPRKCIPNTKLIIATAANPTAYEARTTSSTIVLFGGPRDSTASESGSAPSFIDDDAGFETDTTVGGFHSVRPHRVTTWTPYSARLLNSSPRRVLRWGGRKAVGSGPPRCPSLGIHRQQRPDVAGVPDRGTVPGQGAVTTARPALRYRTLGEPFDQRSSEQSRIGVEECGESNTSRPASVSGLSRQRVRSRWILSEVRGPN